MGQILEEEKIKQEASHKLMMQKQREWNKAEKPPKEYLNRKKKKTK